MLHQWKNSPSIYTSVTWRFLGFFPRQSCKNKRIYRWYIESWKIFYRLKSSFFTEEKLLNFSWILYKNDWATLGDFFLLLFSFSSLCDWGSLAIFFPFPLFCDCEPIFCFWFVSLFSNKRNVCCLIVDFIPASWIFSTI